VGRFPNLARMARDILTVQGGSVGVEWVFSMARDVIPYRRSRLKSSTIRSSMLVKSYENEELLRQLAGHDSEREAEKLEEMAAAEDYRYWANRKEESIENDNGCISDDDKSHKKDTEWFFVDQDGRRAFGREPKAILPERGLVESQYALPGPPRNQGVDDLEGSEESDPEERIWDSTVNMYVACDTDEEEGSQEGEAEIPGEGLSDLRVRYGADRAPKNAGPRPFSPPRPTQRPRAGCLFRHSLPLSPLRPPPHPYPRRVPVKNRW